VCLLKISSDHLHPAIESGSTWVGSLIMRKPAGFAQNTSGRRATRPDAFRLMCCWLQLACWNGINRGLRRAPFVVWCKSPTCGIDTIAPLVVGATGPRACLLDQAVPCAGSSWQSLRTAM